MLFGEKRESKLAAFLRHPLVALVLGFALTGVLGKLLQDRLDTSRREAEQREARRTAALAVVDSVGLRLNRLYYDAGRYYDALREHSGDPANTVIVTRRQQFDSTGALFEAHEYVDAARVCINFGDSLEQEYRTVADSMHWVPVRLRELAKGVAAPELAARHIDNLRSLVANFALSMVRGAALAGDRKAPRCTAVSSGPSVPRVTSRRDSGG